LKEKSKKRKFIQTVELIVVFSQKVDTKDLKSKLQYITLPYYENSKVIVIREVAKKENEISIKEIEEMAKSKRLPRKFANSYDFALAEQKLLPIIGKLIGKYLAVRGKMPIAIKDEKKVEEEIEKLKKSVKINIKQNQIQLKVGKENLENEKLAKNILSAIEQIISQLPRKERDIKKIMIKLTMSKPVKLY